MLSEKRIKEAESNVKKYLSEDLLRKISIQDINIKRVLINNSDESIKIAELSFNNNTYLWTIVCSYYSMYYIAKAILYTLKYKVGEKISHKITADALIVFVRNKLKFSIIEDYEEARGEALEISGQKDDELIESFDQERIKRSKFQYSMTEEVKRAKAETSLARAKEFIFEIKKLLEEKNEKH